jgi:hypothetical protein
VATPFYARQWQNLIDLVKSILVLQDDSTSNAARITVLENTEIGGDNVDIEPALAPLSAGNITLNLSDTAVTPATYGDATNVPQITVDQKGRVTSVVDVPITGGGGSAWTFIATTTISTPTANFDYNNLSAYSDILIVTISITKTAAAATCLRCSVDNGSTFFSGATDYTRILDSGAVTQRAEILLHDTALSSARGGVGILSAINTSVAVKTFIGQSEGAGIFTGSASPVDAIRVTTVSGTTMTGGTIHIFAR